MPTLLSLRAERSNLPPALLAGDCFVASLLAMTGWERLHRPQPPSPAMRERDSAALFLLGDGALGIEALDVAALGAGGRVDDGVDQGGLAGGERIAQRLGEARRVGTVIAGAAERLDDLFIAGVAQQAGRRIRPVGRIAAIDA